MTRSSERYSIDRTAAFDRRPGPSNNLGPRGWRGVLVCLLASATMVAAGFGASASATPPASSAKALATRELLPASAYPSRWKRQGPGSTNTDASFFGGVSSSLESQIAACIGISTTNIDTTPVEAASREYDDPNSNVTVNDTVDVFPSKADAVADVEAASNAKTPGCLVQILGTTLSKEIAQKLGQGSTVGQITAMDRSIPSYGERDADVVLSFPFTYRGVSGTEYLEMVTVQKGRCESNLQFSNSGGPAPIKVLDKLAKEAAQRLG